MAPRWPPAAPSRTPDGAPKPHPSWSGASRSASIRPCGGIAPCVDGNIGIIHFDRHVDTQELDLDERMHTTPWFHATNIPPGVPTLATTLPPRRTSPSRSGGRWTFDPGDTP
ncbi:hypothetical protein FAIPA1_270056 [Frankia sp. AiPs1]